MVHTWQTARSEGRLTSPGARGTLPRDAWLCLGQAAWSRRWRGGLAVEKAQVVPKTMVAIQSTAEPPPPESPKGSRLQPDFSVVPTRPFPLTVGFCLTSQGQLGPKERDARFRTKWGCWARSPSSASVGGQFACGAPAWHILTWGGHLAPASGTDFLSRGWSATRATLGRIGWEESQLSFFSEGSLPAPGARERCQFTAIPVVG